MTLIDRYIARQIAWTSLWALLALAGVIWISQALHDIDLMTTQGQSLIKFFAVTILTLPAMASIIAPVAFLIGLIVTLNRLNQESELAVLASAGLSPTRLLKPLLIMGLVAALLTGLLTLIVVPQSIQTWRTTITQIRSDFLTKIVKAGRFNELEAKVVFHYRERAGDALLGVRDRRALHRPLHRAGAAAGADVESAQAHLVADALGVLVLDVAVKGPPLGDDLAVAVFVLGSHMLIPHASTSSWLQSRRHWFWKS